MMFESFFKNRKSWDGSAFQIPEAADENNLEAAMVLRVGTHIDKDKERCARAGIHIAG